jgi:hypothetical protein
MDSLATHWAAAKDLQQRFPKVRVEMDRTFIADGPVWTSVGMAAGIDLALGLTERDMGQDIARATARTMVFYHRRAGGQSQHSAMLGLDAKSDRVQMRLAYASATGSGSAVASCASSDKHRKTYATPRTRSLLFRPVSSCCICVAAEQLSSSCSQIPFKRLEFDRHRLWLLFDLIENYRHCQLKGLRCTG